MTLKGIDMRYDYALSDNGTAGPHEHQGGKLNYSAKGTFGGGTLSVQSDIGAGFTEVASHTSDDENVLHIPDGSRVQYVLSGASSPSLVIVDRS